MPTLSDEQAKLFTEPNYGVAAAIRPDGTPQLTTVWVDWDGEHVLFNTAEGRWKPKYLRRDPRVTVYVIHRDDPFKWVAVTGPAELTHDGAVEHIDRLAKRYLGRDEFGVGPDEQRVIVRVRPERVIAYGF